jgi:hypothetical protein
MKYFLLLSLLVLSACTTTPEVPSKSASTDVMRLIEQAAVNVSKGVKGTFEFSIKASGIERKIVYLNTELDYRDRRSITVALHPKTTAAFTKKYGAKPEEYLLIKILKLPVKLNKLKFGLSLMVKELKNIIIKRI